jgi:transcriptional regulator with XRE-family HTH domain
MDKDNLPSGYIQKIMNRKRALTLDTLNEISNYFDIPILFFFLEYIDPLNKVLLIRADSFQGLR